MRKLVVVIFVLATVVFLASLVGLFVLRANTSQPDPARPDAEVTDLRVPAFSLVDQHGRPVTEAAFRGRVTVLDFVFTNCPLVCPIMTGQMAMLSDRLAGTGVRFMSISVDPERDTPERLREWGSNFRADFDRWSFVTLPPERASSPEARQEVWSLVRDGLKFAIGDDESLPINLPGGETMYNIRHPSHFILVGPDGRVLGVYLATDDEAVARLEARVRAIAARLPARG